MEEKIIKDIEQITTIRLFKKVMIKLFKGYPAYFYFGIFESYFGKELGEQIVKIIKYDGLIEIVSKEENQQTKYRLTPKGVDFAISMINLEYSEKVLKYSKEMRIFTIVIIVLGILTFGVGLLQLILK